MILIDAVFVNNGGGKILLDQLIEEIKLRNINAQFLLDNRLINTYNHSDFKIPPIFLKANLYARYSFYKNLSESINVVFCFGNIPPPIRLNVHSYTYLHNVLYLESKSYLNFKNKISFILKKIYFNFKIANTTFWIVQTNEVKLQLALKKKILKEIIHVIPFFKTNKIKNSLFNNKNNLITYLYVSSGENYKNHLRLFYAFEQFSINKNVKLIVTITNNYKNLLKKISELQIKNIPIENIGFIDSKQLQIVYQKSNYFIFPSLFESFGLGLIEATNANLAVIASNREYVFEVIEPSSVFDPLNVFSIFSVLENSYNEMLPKSILKIENKIDNLLEILQSYI